jgi:hypothetical protein
MALIVDKLKLAAGGKRLDIGKKRFALAGFANCEEVKVTIGRGVIKIYPANTVLCTACGELPESTGAPYCNECTSRIRAELMVNRIEENLVGSEDRAAVLTEAAPYMARGSLPLFSLVARN